MANQPTSPGSVPPPDVPGAPNIPAALTGYLRNFSLWCQNSFTDRLPGNQALPRIILQAYDATPGATPKVFELRVNTAGSVVITQMPLGSGLP